MSDGTSQRASPSGSSSNNNNKNNKDNKAGDEESHFCQSGEPPRRLDRESEARTRDDDGDLDVEEVRTVAQKQGQKRPRDPEDANYMPNNQKVARRCGRTTAAPGVPFEAPPIRIFTHEEISMWIQGQETPSVKKLLEDSAVIIIPDNEGLTAPNPKKVDRNLEAHFKAHFTSVWEKMRSSGARYVQVQVSLDNLKLLSAKALSGNEIMAMASALGTPAPGDSLSRSRPAADPVTQGRNHYNRSSQQPGPDAHDPSGTCTHCHQPGHTLAVCLGRPHHRGGDIVGCPVCNTKEHFYDACTHTQNFSLEQHLRYLVHNRKNRCMVRTSKDWVAMVNAQRGPSFDAFLWTRKFAIDQLHSSGPKVWDRGGYDYGLGDYNKLPRDPVMTDWSSIRARRLKNEITSQGWGRPGTVQDEPGRSAHAAKSWTMDNVELLNYEGGEADTNDGQESNNAGKDDDQVGPQSRSSEAPATKAKDENKLVDIPTFFQSVRSVVERRRNSADFTIEDFRRVVSEVGAKLDEVPIILTAEANESMQSLRRQKNQILATMNSLQLAKAALANHTNGGNVQNIANRALVDSFDTSLKTEADKLAVIDERRTRIQTQGAELYAAVYTYMATAKDQMNATSLPRPDPGAFEDEQLTFEYDKD